MEGPTGLRIDVEDVQRRPTSIQPRGLNEFNVRPNDTGQGLGMLVGLAIRSPGGLAATRALWAV